MKKLVFNAGRMLYEIEDEPNLIVLGVYHDGGRFCWCNGEIGEDYDVDNCDTLKAALKNEAYEIDVESKDFLPIHDDEPARALVVHTGRLMVHVGRPVDRFTAWGAINEMINKHFEEWERKVPPLPL